jgi:CheY-like chemotaxis protein
MWAHQHGMESVSACGGAEAIEILERHHAAGEPFGFALLDLEMPGMDGCELGRALRARVAGLRMVLLQSTTPSRALDAEVFDAVMAKPPRPDKLTEVVSELHRTGKVREALSSPSVSVFDMPVSPERRLSILVVEDTPVNQKVAQHLLARFGFRAEVAASGEEALAALEQRSYDLVLMDVQMPEMDGLEATRRMRARWPDRDLHIVAMTANVATEDVRRCYQAGMDAFLPKPIDVPSLGRMLRGLVAASAPAAPAGPETDAPVAEQPSVDREVLEQLSREIGPAVVGELVDEFLVDVDRALPDLADGCRAQDRLRVAAAAHKLKSPARSLGAAAFGEMLHALEQQAPAADWSTLQDMVDRLVTQRTGLHDQLRAELASGPASSPSPGQP